MFCLFVVFPMRYFRIISHISYFTLNIKRTICCCSSCARCAVERVFYSVSISQCLSPSHHNFPYILVPRFLSIFPIFTIWFAVFRIANENIFKHDLWNVFCSCWCLLLSFFGVESRWSLKKKQIEWRLWPTWGVLAHKSKPINGNSGEFSSAQLPVLSFQWIKEHISLHVHLSSVKIHNRTAK